MTGVFLALSESGFGPHRWDEKNLVPTRGEPTGIISPGLVDIHFHGAFGIDFMSASRDDMTILADRLEAEGYEAWLPTTVTATPGGVRSALANLPEHRSIVGFHLEGPFISPEFAGAQPPELIIDPPPSGTEWDPILDDPRLRVITMAPERPGALKLAARLHGQGVRVSMGHTNATFAKATQAWNSGFRHATHTFNAMRPFHHREAGAVGFALAQDGLKTELIYDRLHVGQDAARVLLNIKPPQDVIAVSDSAMATGLAPGTELKMWGHECVAGDGDVRIKASGALAGSAITLRTAFKNLVEDFGAEVAIRACCHNPRRAIGLPTEPKVLLVWSLDGELKERIEL